MDKEQGLVSLSRTYNVARFATFSLELEPRHIVLGQGAWLGGLSAPETLERLLQLSSAGCVNIRTFREGESEGRSLPFLMELASVGDILTAIRSFALQGLRSICNESIDIHDGGVSGVAMGDLVEFAPNATPRAVEGLNVARLSRDMAESILSKVYSSPVGLPGRRDERVEFSVHPGPRGIRQSNVVVWGIEQLRSPTPATFTVRWPNLFSRYLGDKAYGLLIADALSCAVPHTVVVSRSVAPFQFGLPTGNTEFWIRTAPEVPEPGHFPTHRNWVDPFKLLSQTPGSERIRSVLSQQGVRALFSGGAFLNIHGECIVEGVSGLGDQYMLGDRLPERLPVVVVNAVSEILRNLSSALGPVRVEWAYDGHTPWVVQLHVGASPVHERIIVDGDADRWIELDGTVSLEVLGSELRALPEGAGILLYGNIGLASHKMELVIKSGRPARFKEAP